jgi:hypothetical protein
MKDEKQIDASIARQLSRSMMKNAKLTARLHALRAVVETVRTTLPDNLVWDNPLRDLCTKALEIDNTLAEKEDL